MARSASEPLLNTAEPLGTCQTGRASTRIDAQNVFGSAGGPLYRTSMASRRRFAVNKSLDPSLLASQRAERRVKHLVWTQLRRQDALHHQTLDQRMYDPDEQLGRHRQLTLVEAA